MVINRTNIFNNMAQFGDVISACNSEVTQRGGSLVVTVDPLLPFCKLYDGTVRHADITPPPETIITTEPMVATIQSTTSALVSGGETDKKVVISIVVSLIAILLFVTMIILILCVCKKGSLKNMIS